MNKIVLLSMLVVCTGSALAAEKKESAKATEVSAIDLSKKIPEAYYYKPGFVISPFKPYNVLNVKHLKPGDYARDPYTAIVNAQNKKKDMKTAKIFRVPQPIKKEASAQSAAE